MVDLSRMPIAEALRLLEKEAAARRSEADDRRSQSLREAVAMDRTFTGLVPYFVCRAVAEEQVEDAEERLADAKASAKIARRAYSAAMRGLEAISMQIQTERDGAKRVATEPPPQMQVDGAAEGVVEVLATVSVTVTETFVTETGTAQEEGEIGELSSDGENGRTFRHQEKGEGMRAADASAGLSGTTRLPGTTGLPGHSAATGAADADGPEESGNPGESGEGPEEFGVSTGEAGRPGGSEADDSHAESGYVSDISGAAEVGGDAQGGFGGDAHGRFGLASQDIAYEAAGYFRADSQRADTEKADSQEADSETPSPHSGGSKGGADSQSADSPEEAGYQEAEEDSQEADSQEGAERAGYRQAGDDSAAEAEPEAEASSPEGFSDSRIAPPPSGLSRSRRASEIIPGFTKPGTDLLGAPDAEKGRSRSDSGATRLAPPPPGLSRTPSRGLSRANSGLDADAAAEGRSRSDSGAPRLAPPPSGLSRTSSTGLVGSNSGLGATPVRRPRAESDASPRIAPPPSGLSRTSSTGISRSRRASEIISGVSGSVADVLSSMAFGQLGGGRGSGDGGGDGGGLGGGGDGGGGLGEGRSRSDSGAPRIAPPPTGLSRTSSTGLSRSRRASKIASRGEGEGEVHEVAARAVSVRLEPEASGGVGGLLGVDPFEATVAAAASRGEGVGVGGLLGGEGLEVDPFNPPSQGEAHDVGVGSGGSGSWAQGDLSLDPFNPPPETVGGGGPKGQGAGGEKEVGGDSSDGGHSSDGEEADATAKAYISGSTVFTPVLTSVDSLAVVEAEELDSFDFPGALGAGGNYPFAGLPGSGETASASDPFGGGGCGGGGSFGVSGGAAKEGEEVDPFNPPPEAAEGAGAGSGGSGGGGSLLLVGSGGFGVLGEAAGEEAGPFAALATPQAEAGEAGAEEGLNSSDDAGHSSADEELSSAAPYLGQGVGGAVRGSFDPQQPQPRLPEADPFAAALSGREPGGADSFATVDLLKGSADPLAGWGMTAGVAVAPATGLPGGSADPWADSAPSFFAPSDPFATPATGATAIDLLGVSADPWAEGAMEGAGAGSASEGQEVDPFNPPSGGVGVGADPFGEGAAPPGPVSGAAADLLGGAADPWAEAPPSFAANGLGGGGLGAAARVDLFDPSSQSAGVEVGADPWAEATPAFAAAGATDAPVSAATMATFDDAFSSGPLSSGRAFRAADSLI